MQLITLLSASATVTSASASILSALQLNQECDLSKPNTRVINRCDYDVHVWSVVKGAVGCPEGGMVTLKKGEVYNENYRQPGDGEGVSIKIGKTTNCKDNNIVQLEYFLETRQTPTFKDFNFNFLDVSYVDCLGHDCPTKNEGYYLQAGTPNVRAMKATSDNSWCPIMSCSGPDSCAQISYINPDDVRTKTCDLTANMDFYMCGSEAPSDDDEKPAPASSPEQKPAYTPEPTPTTPLVDLHAVTQAPAVKDIAKEAVKVKTEVVYVTAIEYVNEKRHAHAHAHGRRHQRFHA